MHAAQLIQLADHIVGVLSLAGGGAWTAKTAARPVCHMVVALAVLIKVDKNRLTDALKYLPKP